MTLAELLDGIISGPIPAKLAASAVTGVFDDSRKLAPGGVFVALRGSLADGGQFVADALNRGAMLVIGEDLAPGERVLKVADARATLARLAARWFGLDQHSSKMRLLAVTGTNGKTTTAHMTREILRAAGQRCGMFGTVQVDLCSRSIQADMTTPPPLQLAAHLAEAAQAGADAVVMEASSHALDQRRTEGLRFAAAAFTNLTRDHLDYHKTMEAYGAAKARLFAGLDKSAVAVVNRDDPACETMVRECRARIVGYSLKREAEIFARISRDTIGGTLYHLRIERRDLVIENAILGRHNVYNAMAAAGLALAAGAGVEAVQAGLARVRNIPGRLQRVPVGGNVEVLVDYAHTDDALRNVLSVLRPLTRKHLIVVFGCGGDRDTSKRPLMAAAAAELAHAVIVTSDNPRTEDARRIIDEIAAGFTAEQRRRVLIEPDRAAAIRAALAGAQPGDVVLIAGKGHEDYQVIGREKIHFDDVEMALRAAAELGQPAEALAR